MKRLLDYLLARQQRLLAELEETPALAPKRALTSAELAALRASEQADVDTAEAHLSRGDLEAAAAALTPHAQSAKIVKTLTLLSRIRSAQGHHEDALGLLTRAEQLDPADPKVAYFMAELLQSRGLHQEAIHFRRRVAYSTADGSAEALSKLISTVAKASAGRANPPVSEIRAALTRLKALGPNDPPALRDTARALFGLRGFSDDARLLIQESDPCPEDHEDVDARWIDLRDWSAAAGTPLHRVKEAGEPGRRPHLAELRDVVVYPRFQWLPALDSNRVLLSGLASSRIRLRHEDPASPLLLSDDHRAVLRVPRSIRRASGPALLVGGVGSFYHDVVEYVGSLAVAESLGMDRDLPLVVNEDLAPHQRQLMDMLGYRQDRLFRVDPGQPIFFDRLFVPTRLAAGGKWFDPLLPSWYRRRLAGSAEARGTRKLYLTRSGTVRRRLLNEEAVTAWFVRRGFEVVAPESHSVQEQVALFAQASHIAGPAGGAMTGMLFAAPGAKLTMLYSRYVVQGGGDLYFDAMARACRHSLQMIECSPVVTTPGQRIIDSDLRVDLDRLDSALV